MNAIMKFTVCLTSFGLLLQAVVPGALLGAEELEKSRRSRVTDSEVILIIPTQCSGIVIHSLIKFVHPIPMCVCIPATTASVTCSAGMKAVCMRHVFRSR